MRKLQTPPPLDWPNFAVFLDEMAERYSSRVALRFRGRGSSEFEEWSYARLAAESRGLSAYLRSRGVMPGDRVAVWSENRLEWAAAYLGVVSAGMVAVPVDALADAAEFGAILSASEAAALVVSGRYRDSLEGLSREVKGLKACVILPAQTADSARALPAGMIGWQEAVSQGAAVAVPQHPEAATHEKTPDLGPGSLASIIFTSGTTGRPKGVMLSHGGIIANIDAARQALPIDAADVFMCVLPLHHTYSTTCSLLSPLSIGASVTICEKVVGKVIVDDVRDSQGSVMIAVPLLYDKLAQALLQGVAARPQLTRAFVGLLLGLSALGLRLSAPELGVRALAFLRNRTGLGSLRLLVAGGGPLNVSTAEVFDRFGFTIVQGYGMSENGPLITTNRIGHRDHRSAGLPVMRTGLRIAGTGQDGIGEIQVRSPSLMLGYWRDEESTAAAFTEDGWLRTGDLGRVDSRGFVFITGRIKSIIVTSGGKNIYPEEIESRFEGSSIVKELLVVGRAHADNRSSGGAREAGGAGGETVCAVIVPDYEAIEATRGKAFAADRGLVFDLVKAEVERVNRSLPPYKKLSDFALREVEFEKTSSRKIKRYLYRSWSEALSR
ncbi:MAG TPA: AMP-binding protein [Rectinemataceae bacterium]|nr:AMP-binding protein [Rectinemataceae bacterium]